MRDAAHPMIQPSDWAHTPQSKRDRWPQDRVSLYQLIWDSAIATQLKAPLLGLRRTFYAPPLLDLEPDIVIGVDQWRSTGAHQGYWQARRDLPGDAGRPPATLQPSITNPANDPVPAVLRIAGVKTVSVGALSISELILMLERRGVTSPANVDAILRSLFEGDAPLLALCVPHPDGEDAVVSPSAWSASDVQSGYCVTTPAGAAALEEWVASGRTQVIDRRWWQDRPDAAWRAMGLSDSEVADIERCIDVDLAAVDASDQRAEGPDRPVKLNLPRDLDPQVHLPATHPLRALKARMEEMLGTGVSDWATMADETRQGLRLDWLRHAAAAGELPPDVPLSEPFASLSPLTRWLVGRPVAR